MSTGWRLPPYPLDAVRDNERWKLEALQSRLAKAIADQGTLADRHRHLIGAVDSEAACASAVVGSVIDPDGSGRRLRFIGELQNKRAVAAHAVEVGDAACASLRLAAEAQRIRVRSIERHRENFQRREEREAERLQCIDAERGWLARAAWMARSGSSSTGVPDANQSSFGRRRP